MKSRNTATILTACLFSLILSLGGCASTGAKTAEGDAAMAAGNSISVVLLSDDQVRARYGRTPSNDPFIPPAADIFVKPYDYIILQLTAVSAGGGSLEILQAEVQDAKGKVQATFYNKEKFADLAASLTYDPENIAERQNRISWYYLPSERMHINRGKSEYVMILVGKHPLPDGLTAGVRLLFNGEEKAFSMPVPDAPAKSD
jgi:hypothetical protein